MPTRFDASGENGPTEVPVPELSASYSVGHLHLQPESLSVLEGLNIFLIGDAFKLPGPAYLPKTVATELSTALEQLRAVTLGGVTDWLAYYALRDHRFSGLFFDCLEFTHLTGSNPGFRVNRQTFGNAGAMFERAGFESFGKLLEALRNGIPETPRGMGYGKQQAFWKRLCEIAEDTRAGGDKLAHLMRNWPVTDAGNSDPDLEPGFNSGLTESTRTLDIGLLHLGAKTETLRLRGINNIGQLMEASRGRLLRKPGLGKSTVTRANQALAALAEAESPEGAIDWQSFCAAMGLALLPADPGEGTIEASIMRLPSVLKDILRSDDSPMIHSIVTNRIIRRPAERMTLEEIAISQPTPVTRQRIRQIEARFLSRLAAALIENDYAHAPFHFRAEFTAPWQSAARYFADSEREMSLNDLLSGLEECWQLRRDKFAPLTPLIVAIFTGTLPAAAEYNRTLLTDWTTLSRGADSPLGLPVNRLQLGEFSAKLEAAGVRTIGQLIREIERDNELTRYHKKNASANIDALVGAADSLGHIDWRRYAELIRVPFLPNQPSDDPTRFLNLIIPVSQNIIEHRKRSAIAKSVFTDRSAVSSQNRPTIEALAQKLGKYAPTVKRVETEVLAFLNAIFVDQNLAAARLQVCPKFLQKWGELNQWFQAVDGDPQALGKRISIEWRIPDESVSLFIPVIFAILTGYPLGRPGKQSGLVNRTYPTVVEDTSVEDTSGEDPVDLSSMELPERVVLKGFRRIH